MGKFKRLWQGVNAVLGVFGAKYISPPGISLCRSSEGKDFPKKTVITKTVKLKGVPLDKLTNDWYQPRLTRFILKGGIMETVWKLQDAKSQFSKVVQNALKSGPQYVTRRGTKAVVVLSVRDYEKLISNKLSFKDFLLSCPKMDEDFQIERQKDYPRNIEL